MSATTLNGKASALARLAEQKRLPLDYLRRLEVCDSPLGGVLIPYYDGAGNLVLERTRDAPGGPRFRQPAGVGLVPYGRWRRSDASGPGILYLVEGESDCWTLWYHDLPALGIPGSSGAGCLESEDLAGVERLYVVREPDRGGETFVAGIARRLAELGYDGRAYMVEMPAEHKDPSDLHAADPEQFKERWRRLVEKAKPLEIERKQKSPSAGADEPEFTFISSRDFAAASYRREWHIRRVLVKGQPGALGGPKKGMKTGITVDAAVSMGVGKPFLGYFEVERPARVAVISGESGEATLQETAVRVCREKGVDLADVNACWGFRLPQLADDKQLSALRRALEREAVEVLFLDPLYLSLLSGVGPGGPQAGNVYQMGPLLLGVATACLDAGCTPILCHHFKARPNPHDEPQLEDLAFSGIGEFARQWVLLARRERYQPGTGHHDLWLSVGGSAGHSGLWAVTIDEGTVDEHFSGRTWDVVVTNPGEVRQARKETKEAGKREETRKQDTEDEAAVMQALDKLDEKGRGYGFNRVKIEARLSDQRMERAVTRLKEQRLVEEIPDYVAEVGNGGLRKARGIRRVMERGT